MNSDPLFKATGKGVKVGIIDDGIWVNGSSDLRLAGGVRIRFDESKHLILDSDYLTSNPGSHGTLCAALIARRVPDAELYSLRVTQRNSLHPRVLAAAIKWAIDNKLNILNVSVGTTATINIKELRALCEAAVQARVVIVAATHPRNLVSYPSAFPEAISVGEDDRYKDYVYGYHPTRRSQFIASGRAGLESVPGCHLQGSGVAAARMTANVAAELELMPAVDLGRLKAELAAHQTPPPPVDPADGLTTRPRPDTVVVPRSNGFGRVAIYPNNRSTEEILTYQDQFPFAIDCIIDPIHPSTPGEDAGELYGLPRLQIPVVANFNSIAPETESLVVGNLAEEEMMQRRDYMLPALEWAAQNNKHVFSLDPRELSVYGDLFELASKRGLSLRSAHTLFHDVMESDVSLPQSPIDVPVVGVFGTSFNQGKLATQLALRRWLRKEGYEVGVIGPNAAVALLEGGIYVPQDPLCHCRPGVSEQAFAWEIAVAQAFSQRPDLILIGTQGGIVPHGLYPAKISELYNFPPDYSLPSLAALMGAKPDAAILVVNTRDTEDHIKRSIAVIEALSQEPVIAICIANRLAHKRLYGYDQRWARRLNSEELLALKHDYQQVFGVPAFCPFIVEDQQRLAKRVLGSFHADETQREDQRDLSSPTRA